MSWTGFLPKNAVVMARVVRGEAPVEPLPESLPEPHPDPSAPAAASAALILAFLESEPDPSGRALLARMMSAIQVSAESYVVEWGDFPASQAPFVLGVGLGARKGGRLSALRPEWVALPSLAEIGSDPARKREAWDKLQALQTRLKLEGVLS
jgi:hypothetical protein